MRAWALILGLGQPGLGCGEEEPEPDEGGDAAEDSAASETGGSGVASTTADDDDDDDDDDAASGTVSGSGSSGGSTGVAEPVCPWVEEVYNFTFAPGLFNICRDMLDGNLCWVKQTECAVEFDCNGNLSQRFPPGPLDEDGEYEGETMYLDFEVRCSVEFDAEATEFEWRCIVDDTLCEGSGWTS